MDKRLTHKEHIELCLDHTNNAPQQCPTWQGSNNLSQCRCLDKIKDCYWSNGRRKGKATTSKKKYRKQLAKYMVYHIGRTCEDRLETIQDWIWYKPDDDNARFLVPMRPINTDKADVADSDSDSDDLLSSTGTAGEIQNDATTRDPVLLQQPQNAKICKLGFDGHVCVELKWTRYGVTNESRV